MNERDLNFDCHTSCGNDKIAFYPLEKLPTVDQKTAVPVDRKQGLQDCKEAMHQLGELKKEFAPASRN